MYINFKSLFICLGIVEFTYTYLILRCACEHNTEDSHTQSPFAESTNNYYLYRAYSVHFAAKARQEK